MASVRLEHVTKRFGEVVALDDISLQVEDGEFVVLVGSSGCGKTTLLRLIAGLDKPDAGSIYIDQTSTEGMPPQQRQVGMVFQSPALYPHLSVQANLSFGLPKRGVAAQQIGETIHKTASMLGIESLLNRFPHELSGGEQQRVALGKALARGPHVWLLDEPLSNLDMNLRFALRTELRTLQRQLGITTLLVTHDLTEAMSLADRIVVIDVGCIRQIGSPKQIYEQPNHRVVATALAQPPINLIKARIGQMDRSRVVIHFGELALQVPLSKEDSILAADQIVDLGVRAEDISIVRVDSTTPSSGVASVERIERLGAESFVHLRADTTRMIARLPSSHSLETQPDDTVSVTINADRVHLFDRASGARLN